MPNDLYIFLESGETNIFLIEMFTASKLSFKIGYIFWDTQYIIIVFAWTASCTVKISDLVTR